MIHLPRSLSAWNTPAFKDVLKQEIEQSGGKGLPLQQGLTSSSYALEGGITAMILGVTEAEGRIQAKVGIFYAGITPGCSCADDPTPVEPQPEYCELEIVLDKGTAAASAALL
jgi:hypothetical protein